MYRYPAQLIAILHRKTQIFWYRELKPYGIYTSEIPVFMQLFLKEGLSQDEISQNVGLDKSAIARITYGMIERGFIIKKKDPGDRRCNQLYLTEKGRQMREPIMAARNRLNKRLLNQMDETDRQEFLRLLKLAADSIQKEEGE